MVLLPGCTEGEAKVNVLQWSCKQFARILFSITIASLFTVFQGYDTTRAHEAWFVQEGGHAGEHFSFGPTNLFVILGAALFITLAFAVHHANWFRKIDYMARKAQRVLPSGIEWRMVAILAGIMLIANSVTGVFLAPNLVLPGSGLVIAGGVAQAIVGALLISQFSFLLAGLLVVVVAIPIAFIFLPSAWLIDYGFEYVSLTLALVFFGVTSNCRDKAVCKLIKREPWDLSHLPLPIIRIGLGLTIISLSLRYKLLNPDFALTFLDKYDFNFMPHLGFVGFTNLHFVFAAGIAEFTLGLLLLTGIATRFVAAGLLLFLLTTLIILGIGELIGHLPVIGIAILLVYRGSGTFPVARKRVPIESSVQPSRVSAA